jgi:hypothetical protein
MERTNGRRWQRPRRAISASRPLPLASGRSVTPHQSHFGRQSAIYKSAIAIRQVQADDMTAFGTRSPSTGPVTPNSAQQIQLHDHLLRGWALRVDREPEGSVVPPNVDGQRAVCLRSSATSIAVILDCSLPKRPLTQLVTARLKAIGSILALRANSSMKHSMANTLLFGPTPRQKPVGTAGGSARRKAPWR